MKNIFLIICLFFFNKCFSQIDFSSVKENVKSQLSLVGPGIKIGGGFNTFFVPSRNNFMDTENGIPISQLFTTTTNKTVGVELDLAISPIQNDYFSYYFKLNTTIGWLGNSTQSSLYRGHEFNFGTKSIKGIFEIGTVLFRKVNNYSVSYFDANSYKENLGRSIYSDIRRISFGAKYILSNNSEIEIRFLKEYYNFENRTSSGAIISFNHKGNVLFYAESIFSHPIKGIVLVNNVPTNLQKEGLYLRVGVVKYFRKKSIYKDLFYKY